MSHIKNSIDLAGYKPSSYYQRLFPYLQVQPSPEVDQQDKANAFFEVSAGCKNTELYKQLAGLKQSGQRLAMQHAAVSYINSTAFIRSPQGFSPTFTQFFNFTFDDRTDSDSIYHFINNHFQSPDQFSSYLAGEEFQQQLNSAWLTIICLLIELDYQLPWLEQLLGLLTGINILHHGAAYIKQQQTIPQNLMSQWLNANFLLPGELFPMPPAAQKKQADNTPSQQPDSVSSAPTDTHRANSTAPDQRVMPYALGTLHLVEYRLAGYQLGELKKVENILYGETRRTSSRYLSQSDQQQDKGLLHNTDVDAHHQSTDKDFSDAVQKTLHDRTVTTDISKYETDYAPTSPKAQTQGHWTINESPEGGFDNNQMQFAKDIIQQASNKVMDQVKQDRRSLSSDQQELSYLSEFQNHEREGHVTGFYHWLNKQYDVRAYDTDKRLLLELTFDVPKDEIMTLLDLHHPLHLEMPLTLQEYGIQHYSDIKAEPEDVTIPQGTDSQTEANNSKLAPSPSPSPSPKNSGCYYLDACQQFSVTDIPAPPAASCYISQSLKGEQTQSSTLLTIPEGYYASSVELVFSGAVNSHSANTNAPDKTDNIQLLIGNQSINAQAGHQSIQLSDRPQGTLPVAVVVTGNQPLNGSYGVNLTVKAERCPQTLASWQYQVFSALQSGYQQQLKHYQHQLKAQKTWLEDQDNPINQNLINRQIMLQSMQALYLQAKKRIGLDPAAPHSELPYRQYFEQSLDWDYLYCKLIYNDQDDNSNHGNNRAHSSSEHSISTLPILAELDSQLYLKRFLLASQLKVLIPVQRDYVQSVLYFLDCGRIWHGQSRLAPTNPASLSICNDFKKLRNQFGKQETGNWQVTLPTNMVVLNRSSDLSDINSAIRNLNNAD